MQYIIIVLITNGIIAIEPNPQSIATQFGASIYIAINTAGSTCVH